MIERIRFLATGRAEWENTETGAVHVTKEDWKTRWALSGIHSNRWRWVNRWGALDCGCTRNPLTRRLVLINSSCVPHMGWDMWADA